MRTLSGATRRRPRICAITALPFDKAVKAFADPFAVEWIDEREAYDEERYNLLGHVRGRDPARDLHGAR